MEQHQTFGSTVHGSVCVLLSELTAVRLLTFPLPTLLFYDERRDGLNNYLYHLSLPPSLITSTTCSLTSFLPHTGLSLFHTSMSIHLLKFSLSPTSQPTLLIEERRSPTHPQLLPINTEINYSVAITLLIIVIWTSNRFTGTVLAYIVVYSYQPAASTYRVILQNTRVARESGPVTSQVSSQ